MFTLPESVGETLKRNALTVFARIELRDIRSAWWASCWALEALRDAEAREPGVLCFKLPADLFGRLSATGVLGLPRSAEFLSSLRKFRIRQEEEEEQAAAVLRAEQAAAGSGPAAGGLELLF